MEFSFNHRIERWKPFPKYYNFSDLCQLYAEKRSNLNVNEMLDSIPEDFCSCFEFHPYTLYTAKIL